jgi:Domain of unknown function (DUF4136)
VNSASEAAAHCGRLAALLTGLLSVTACSGISISTGYDHAADFSKYHTYAWKAVRPAQNAAVENGIRAAVDSVMASKGLWRVDSDPDLWAVEHTRLSEQAAVATYDSGWGYSSRWGWGGSTTSGTVSAIPVGTLVLDLVDARDKQLVWRGTADDAVDTGASPEQRDKTTLQAVQKLLAGFPPGS